MNDSKQRNEKQNWTALKEQSNKERQCCWTISTQVHYLQTDKIIREQQSTKVTTNGNNSRGHPRTI